MPPAVEIDQAISWLQRFSGTRTEELKAEFTNPVAIDDLADITGQLQALQPVPALDDFPPVLAIEDQPSS